LFCPLPANFAHQFPARIWDWGRFGTRFSHRRKDIESEIFGKRNVFETKHNKQIVEIDIDGQAARTVSERRVGGVDPYVDYNANHLSVSLGQLVFATKQVGRVTKEKIETEAFGVVFFDSRATSSFASVAGVFDGLHNGVVRRKRISDFFEESQRSQLTPKGKTRGMMCKHPSDAKVEFWLNSEGLLGVLRWQFLPGDRGDDGSVCPVGKWSKFETHIEWSKSSQPRLVSLENFGEAKGAPKTSLVYKLTESDAMEKPLGTLIELQGLGLKNGVSVSCSAQPANQFSFYDGRVLAIVDKSGVVRAETARWQTRGAGQFYWQVGLAFMLVISVFVFIWKRRKE